MFGAGVRNQVAPPQIAAFLPVDIAAGAFQDHHVLNAFHVRVFSASSTFFFSGMARPARSPSSAVITVRELESIMRPATASGEAAEMTEWIAPMRAQASIATAASGTIGI